MNTQHTPGPWEHLWTNKVVHVVPHKRDVERYENIATVLVPDGGHGVKTANARLIAAAPELLEAVKISLEFLDRQNTPKNIQEQISFKNHQREILTKVIAKAEGK